MEPWMLPVGLGQAHGAVLVVGAGAVGSQAAPGSRGGTSALAHPCCGLTHRRLQAFEIMKQYHPSTVAGKLILVEGGGNDNGLSLAMGLAKKFIWVFLYHTGKLQMNFSANPIFSRHSPAAAPG